VVFPGDGGAVAAGDVPGDRLQHEEREGNVRRGPKRKTAARGRRSPSNDDVGSGGVGGSPGSKPGQEATGESEDLASPPNRARARRTTAYRWWLPG
jgi:hypothetical protein